MCEGMSAMQRISTGFRFTAHALILAFVALTLVVIGCNGAQASAAQQVAITVSATTPASAPASNAVALKKATAQKENPACAPSGSSARVEKIALAPSPALLPHSPSSVLDQLSPYVLVGDGLSPHSGRIPAALTHLDLGIVRT